jgi:hypothetical protein
MMKYLKSTYKDLRHIFEISITVNFIAESMISFDAEKPASEIRDFLKKQDYDVVGVRKDGSIAGYAERDALSEGCLGDYLEQFEPGQVLESNAPLRDVFSIICQNGTCFVTHFGNVNGIITKGDLQKAPVRMWLFGLITMIEMQMLRLIRETYPEDQWESCLSIGRLDSVDRIFADRAKRNAQIDRADCLQFCDKRTIFEKTSSLVCTSGFEAKRDFSSFFKQFENLRNELAHSQDIITGNWPGLVDQISEAERLLECLEKN